MREIIFRGKRIDDGKWVYGHYVHQYGANMIYLPNGVDYECGFDYYHIEPPTLGQYTGLTAKSGKIFEGDIFLIDDEYHAVVIFEDGCFRLQVHGLCGTYTEGGYCEDGGGYGIIECDPIDWFYVHDMKIIGNIHDNPELLKGGAE